MTLVLSGSYFCYDNPAALTDTMTTDMEISTSQYMLFYSLYSWPNVILCFFGGFLLDSVFGICWGTIIFSGIVTIGQVRRWADGGAWLGGVPDDDLRRRSGP